MLSEEEMADIVFEREYMENYSLVKTVAQRLLAAVRLAYIYVNELRVGHDELFPLLTDPQAVIEEALVKGHLWPLKIYWDIRHLDQSSVDLRDKDAEHMTKVFARSWYAEVRLDVALLQSCRNLSIRPSCF